MHFNCKDKRWEMFSCALHLSMRLRVQELLIKTTKSYCKYVFVCTSQNYEKAEYISYYELLKVSSCVLERG